MSNKEKVDFFENVYFWVPGDHSNLVRIEFSSKLSQELCQTVQY